MHRKYILRDRPGNKRRREHRASARGFGATYAANLNLLGKRNMQDQNFSIKAHATLHLMMLDAGMKIVQCTRAEWQQRNNFHDSSQPAPQTPPHHELPFIKVHSPFCRKQKTHAAVPSPKKSGGFEINGV